MPGGERGWLSACSRILAQPLNAKSGASKLGGGALGGDSALGCSGRHLVVLFQPSTRLQVLAQPFPGQQHLGFCIPWACCETQTSRVLQTAACLLNRAGSHHRPCNVLSHCLQG